MWDEELVVFVLLSAVMLLVAGGAYAWLWQRRAARGLGVVTVTRTLTIGRPPAVPQVPPEGPPAGGWRAAASTQYYPPSYGAGGTQFLNSSPGVPYSAHGAQYPTPGAQYSTPGTQYPSGGTEYPAAEAPYPITDELEPPASRARPPPQYSDTLPPYTPTTVNTTDIGPELHACSPPLSRLHVDNKDESEKKPFETV